MFVRSICVALLAGTLALAEDRLPYDFLQAHCTDCHAAGADSDGGFDLASLERSLSPQNFDQWVRVVDRIESGEMPPEDAAEVDAAERTAFLEQAEVQLHDFQTEQHQTNGRVAARRLTDLQLERTLHDLLGIDIPLAREMPEEQRTFGYPTVAAGQTFSHFQMQNHVKVVDLALDEAFRRATNPADEFRHKLSARLLARRRQRRRCREPEMLDGKAVVWATRTIYYGRLPATTAKEPGWHRLTLTYSGLNIPEKHGVWCSVQAGKCVSGAPLLRWCDSFSATATPQTRSFEVWLDEGEMFQIRPDDLTQKQGRFAGGQVGAGEGTPQNLTGVAFHEAVLERFHKGPNNRAIFNLLFGNAKHNKRAKSDSKSQSQVVFSEPQKDLAKLMLTFAGRAFRRPVTSDEIRPYLQLVRDQLADQQNELTALRAGYRAILCSPRFLFLQEMPGTLDDYALASRLSYFLCNTMPDQRLMLLAAAGKLNRSDVLSAETERLLNDDKGTQFFADFAHDWLDLRDIDFTQPDRRLYRGFDGLVKNAMLAETHAFLNDLLTHDRSVGHLIQSNFTFLNNRLARHYGIANVAGDKLRKVTVSPESHRGGLLAHGAILKVTANGTTTSPVVRGVWVGERLMGLEIPDPPNNVPAIEPDVRGATGIRELLAKHKSDQNCAACHRKIDPPGFALENFDPAGRWREYYGGARRRRNSKKVDPSEVLLDGTAFRSFQEFQTAVANKRPQLARCLMQHLITYGTGAECGFADRKEIEHAVAELADKNYGVRSIIHAVVQSQIFRTK